MKRFLFAFASVLLWTIASVAQKVPNEANGHGTRFFTQDTSSAKHAVADDRPECDAPRAISSTGSSSPRAVRGTLEYGVSAALHEDNRYFVSGQTGFFRRTKYAVVSTLLARHDGGNQSFSFSRIGSAAGAAFISRAWQPRSITSAGDGTVSFGISMGSDIGFNVVREFWPSLRRHFR